MEHKSERIMQTALANGWKAQIVPEIPATGDHSEIIWNLYCVRNHEKLHVYWIGNTQQPGIYMYGDHRKHPYSRNDVVKILTGRPDPRKFSVEFVEKLMEFREVPFESDTPALEILLSVLGKEVTWVRKIDGEIMKGVVEEHTNLGKKYFRVYTTSTGRRVLEWQDRQGFHAAGLDQIIDVA